MSESDYKSLYEQLLNEFDEFKETSMQYENEMEKQIEELMQEKTSDQHLISKLQDDLSRIRERAKSEREELNAEIDKLFNENTILKEKIKKIQKQLVNVEVENENFQNQQRITESTLSDMESRAEKILEEIAIIQSESEENKLKSYEEIQRLRERVQETEADLTALKKKNTEMVNSQAKKATLQAIQCHEHNEDKILQEKNTNTDTSKGSENHNETKPGQHKSDQYPAYRLAPPYSYSPNFTKLDCYHFNQSKSDQHVNDLIKSLDQKLISLKLSIF